MKEKMQIGLNELKTEKENEMPAHFNTKGDVPVPCCVNGDCTCEPEDEEFEIEDEIED